MLPDPISAGLFPALMPRGVEGSDPQAVFTAGRKERDGADGTQGDVPLGGAAAAAPAPTGAQRASSPQPLASISQCNPCLLWPGSPNKALLEPAPFPSFALRAQPQMPPRRALPASPGQPQGTSGDQPSLRQLGVALIELGGCWLFWRKAGTDTQVQGKTLEAWWRVGGVRS